MKSTLAGRLLALHTLHERGILTDEEFAAAKAREITLAEQIAVRRPIAQPPAQRGAPPPPTPSGPRTLNPVVPGVGLALGAATLAGGGG